MLDPIFHAGIEAFADEGLEEAFLGAAGIGREGEGDGGGEEDVVDGEGGGDVEEVRVEDVDLGLEVRPVDVHVG